MSDPATISRLLVRPPNWLGDAVLALPAIAVLPWQAENVHAGVNSVSRMLVSVTGSSAGTSGSASLQLGSGGGFWSAGSIGGRYIGPFFSASVGGFWFSFFGTPAARQRPSKYWIPSFTSTTLLNVSTLAPITAPVSTSASITHISPSPLPHPTGSLRQLS